MSLENEQRRILEIWANELRQFNPSDSLVRAIDTALNAVNGSRALTSFDRDILEAFAIGEGPHGKALRRVLELCEGQIDEVLPPAPATIRVSDLSALPEADRAVIAHFDAALHGARPAPGSDEAAAIAAMQRFMDNLSTTG